MERRAAVSADYIRSFLNLLLQIMPALFAGESSIDETLSTGIGGVFSAVNFQQMYVVFAVPFFYTLDCIDENQNAANTAVRASP